MFNAPFALSFKELILEFCASAVMFMRLCLLGYEDPLKGNLENILVFSRYIGL